MLLALIPTLLCCLRTWCSAANAPRPLHATSPHAALPGITAHHAAPSYLLPSAYRQRPLPCHLPSANSPAAEQGGGELARLKRDARNVAACMHVPTPGDPLHNRLRPSRSLNGLLSCHLTRWSPLLACPHTSHRPPTTSLFCRRSCLPPQPPLFAHPRICRRPQSAWHPGRAAAPPATPLRSAGCRQQTCRGRACRRRSVAGTEPPNDGRVGLL